MILSSEAIGGEGTYIVICVGHKTDILAIFHHISAAK